jgi:ribosomal protein S18 acetylase RimI-like enzyme
MDDIIKTLERASLEAWPALKSEMYDGWVLRFSNGYTKRANSVNVLKGSSQNLSEKVEYCESVYRFNNLPPIFRITPLAPPELDGILAKVGYKLIHPTWVMTKAIHSQNLVEDWKLLISELGFDEWLAFFSRLSQVPIEREALHTKILSSINAPRLFASLKTGKNGVACGLGVLGGTNFGLYDVVVHPSFRRQGHGQKLIVGMLNWARCNNASIAYLQVMDENLPARKLYRKLGFHDQYRYWYRIPE